MAIRNSWKLALVALAGAALTGCANPKLAAQRAALLKQNHEMQLQLAEARQQAKEAQAAEGTASQTPPMTPAAAPSTQMSPAGGSGANNFLPLNEKLPKNKQGRNGNRHFSWKKYRGVKSKPHFVAHHLKGRYRHIRIVHQGHETRLIIASDILFPSASARVLPRARHTLLHVAYIIHHRYYHRLIKVEGFTDKRPIHHPYKNNYALGLARARSVMRFLAQHGVRQANMRAISFGDKRPVSRVNMALNRRVEIVVR